MSSEGIISKRTHGAKCIELGMSVHRLATGGYEWEAKPIR